MSVPREAGHCEDLWDNLLNAIWKEGGSLSAMEVCSPGDPLKTGDWLPAETAAVAFREVKKLSREFSHDKTDEPAGDQEPEA